MAFKRLRAASGAMAVYVSLRVLTCLLPFLHMALPSFDSGQGASYGLELAGLVLLLTLLTALPYGLALGAFLSGEHDLARSRGTMLWMVAVGALDLASGLAIIAVTDGWSSQFRHYWATALLVPCLILGLRGSLLLAVGSMVITGLTLGLTEPQQSVRVDNLLYLQVGWGVAAVVISGVVGFLGDVVFQLQRSRRSAEIARDNLETMLEITQYTTMVTSGLNDLMRRVAHAIGQRHSYQMVGIYVMESGGEDLKLAGWQGEFETLRRNERPGDNLVHEAISALDVRFVRDGRSWNAAIPIRDINTTVGVLLIGSEGSDLDVRRMTGLGHALVGHIAVGIQVARLRNRLDHAATQQEWEQFTRQIHDRIASSLYSVMMHLETYAEQAGREGSPFQRRLEGMVPSFVQLLIETRHYMYHLLPALRGEIGLDRVVDSMVAEFERASEIPVRLSIGGSAANVPMSTTIGVYHLLQNRLSDILLYSGATAVEISLDMEVDNISLIIADDGVESLAGRLQRMRELAEDIGGRLEVVDGRDGSMKFVLDVVLESSRGSLDQPRDS